MVSSPSNASNVSSVTTSPWRDSPPPPPPQRDQPQGPPLATPASSFGPAPDGALFRGESSLAPTPEAPAARDTKNNAANGVAIVIPTAVAVATSGSKSASPANGFPLRSSTFLDDSSGGDDDDDGDGDYGEDAFDGASLAAGDVRGGGRAAVWTGVSGATPGSVRDFTASRTASSSRRMVERQRSGETPASSGGGI